MRLLLTTISVFVLVQIALSQKRVQLEMLKERDGVMFHHSKPFNGIAFEKKEEKLVVGYESISYEYKYKNGLKHGESKAFYDNQNTLYTRHYNHGKINGICKGYYKNGVIAAVDSYKNGKRDGVSINYYPSGNMMDSCNYVNDKKNGFHYIWDDSKNNELAEKKFFKDGRYISKFEQYINETGFVHFDSLKFKINTDTIFKNLDDFSFVEFKNLEQSYRGIFTPLYLHVGLTLFREKSMLVAFITDNLCYHNFELFNGEAINFSSNNGVYYHLVFKKGKLKKLVCFSFEKKILMAEFENGKIDGSFTTWHPKFDMGNGLSGEKFSFTYHTSIQAEFLEGRINGNYREFYKNGQNRLDVEVQQNQLVGKLKRWFEDGSLMYETNFTKGSGVDKEFYVGGQMQSKKIYKNGRLNGEQKYWHKNGQTHEKVNYEDGVLNGESKTWSKYGELKSKGIYLEGNKHGLWISNEWMFSDGLTEKIIYNNGEKIAERKWVKNDWDENNQYKVSIDTNYKFTDANTELTIINDRNFEQELIDLGYDDFLDGQVETKNISTIDSLSITSRYIKHLDGIEDFTSLTYLDISHNDITNIIFKKKNSLKKLICLGNDLDPKSIKNVSRKAKVILTLDEYRKDLGIEENEHYDHEH